MLIRKRFSMAMILALIAFLITIYQNCAPNNINSNSNNSDANSNLVDTIDNVNSSTKVAFQDEEVMFHNESEILRVTGLCSANQSGALIRWNLFDLDSDEELQKDFSYCKDEAFVIESELIKNLTCNKSYKIIAQLGLGEKGELKVIRRCQADKSIEISNFNLEEFCFYELNVVDNQNSNCQEACYDEFGQLTNLQNVEMQYCTQ